MNNELMFSSKDQTWETPQDFFDRINEEFKFNIDVCASEYTNKCDKYYNEEQNALVQNWDGVCWCNPPYGRSINKWVEKAYNESLKGNIVVMLIPSRTDTRYWHDIIFPYASEIRFIKGRLKFGNAENPAPFPSALIVFGGEKKGVSTI